MNCKMMKRYTKQHWVVLTKPKHTWEALPLEDLYVYSRTEGATVEPTSSYTIYGVLSTPPTGSVR